MNQEFTRRQLIASAIALPALAALPRGIDAAPPEHRMQFGLVTYLWGKDMDLTELLATCEASGLQGVELRTEHKHAVEPSLSKSERKEVQKRFDDSPVELVGYGSNCEYHSNDRNKLQQNIDLTKRYVELMHDCGGSGVKVKPNGFVDGVPHEKTIEQIGKALNEVASFAEGFGQKIRVEVHGKGTSELNVIRDIFAIADHPNVFVCWNSNDEDLKGEGLESNFNLTRDRFGDTVHVRELNQGNYPYGELFKLFRKSNYEGWILLEARTNPQDKVAAMIEQRRAFEQLLA